MLKRTKSNNALYVTLGIAALGVAAFLVTSKLPLVARGPTIPASARNLRPVEDVQVTEFVPPSEVLVDPQVVRKAVPAASTSQAPNTSPKTKAVDGEQYAAELARTVGMTDSEKERVRSYLQTVSRAQEMTARATDEAHRQDMERRLQYQTLAGIQIRVASEKRERVADAVQKGVPRLAFEGSSAR